MDKIKELSKLSGAYIEGKLQNGRYYCRAVKHFAYVPPIKIRWWQENTPSPASTVYYSKAFEITFEVDYYFLQYQTEEVAQYVRQRFDELYEGWVKQNPSEDQRRE